MRFYTKEECETWLSDRQQLKPDSRSGMQVERIDFPRQPYRFFFLARCMATEITFDRPALLVLTEWDIWPSSENWHLYYKLRQSYGDMRLLADAPGHLFLKHETEDLASFLQLSMLNGWGGYIVTEANYVSAFFSHDEYIDFYANDPTHLSHMRKALGTEQSGG